MTTKRKSKIEFAPDEIFVTERGRVVCALLERPRGASFSSLVDDTGLPDKEVALALCKLAELAFIHQDKEGNWRLGL